MDQSELDAKLEIALEGAMVQWLTPFTGWSKELWSNGQVKELRELQDDKPNGPWFAWYENGNQKFECHYKQGMKHGAWFEWYENGQKKLKAHFSNGRRNGKWIEWHENGQMKSEQYFLYQYEPNPPNPSSASTVVSSAGHSGNKARNLGKTAFRHGVVIYQNPYVHGDPDWFAWNEGWVYEKTYRHSGNGD